MIFALKARKNKKTVFLKPTNDFKLFYVSNLSIQKETISETHNGQQFFSFELCVKCCIKTLQCF